jgi:CRP/FNR family transcriptional regulator, cyclic AMP receptor protein
MFPPGAGGSIDLALWSLDVTGRFGSAACYRRRVLPGALRRCTLFESLSADQLAKVAEIATPREVPAGEVIFPEGAAGDEMYVVVSGRVRISKEIPGAGEEALTLLGPGGYFGEMAVIDDAPRSADAVAHVGCSLLVIRREDLDRLMFLDKDLACALLWAFVRTLSSRLRETSEKLRSFFALAGPGGDGWRPK